MKAFFLLFAICLNVYSVGQFEPPILISNESVAETHCADLDGDNLADIVGRKYSPHQIVWFKNLGDATFDSPIVLTTIGQDLTSMGTADLDLDGDLDIVASDINEVFWMENDAGTFSSPNYLSSTGGIVRTVESEDMDNDGDLDLAAYQSSFPDVIFWYENLGAGNFSDAIEIDASYMNLRDIHIGDFNGDGFKDVLGYDLGLSELFWLENLDGGGFSPPLTLSQTAYLEDMTTTDLDSDGDQDILLCDDVPEFSGWYENNGEGEVQEMSLHPNDTIGGFQIFAQDLDGDQDKDVIIQSVWPTDYDIFWHENLGDGEFSASNAIIQVFQDGFGYYQHSSIGNMDEDEDLDFIYATSNEIYFIENTIGEGCLDVTACNFDPDAFNENGTCCYGVCGCMDPGSVSYNPLAECDDGSCMYEISGYVFYDDNENGLWDDEDYGLALQELTLLPGEVVAFTNDDGYFSFTVNGLGHYSVSLAATDVFPFIINTNPQVLEIVFDTPIEEIVLGLSNDAPMYEVDVDFYTDGEGYPCDLWHNHNICFRNEGNVTIDGVVEVEFDPLFQDYQEVTPIDSVFENHIFMSFQDLQPGQIFCYTVQLLTPTVDFIGEIIFSYAHVYGYYEGEPVAYGQDDLVVHITCAYDPNDKQAFPPGYAEPHFIDNGQELEYLVRFQNTGNAPASDVLVQDTLDVNLDLNSFELVANSHSVAVTLNPETRLLNFFFEDIMLPDSTCCEPESHGFISFRISPHNNLPPGTEINNTAYIYFDNNPPIVTNTTWHTIYECTEELAEIAADEWGHCPGEVISLSANEEYTDHYSWLIADEEVGNSSELTISMPDESFYITLVAENPLCIATDSVLIESLSTVAYAGEDATICEGDSLLLSATGGTFFEWVDVGINAMEQVQPEQSTTYVVHSWHSENCISTDSMTVEVLPTPEAHFTQQIHTLEASEGDSYQWYHNGLPIAGATSQYFTMQHEGVYKVEVFLSDGCPEFSESRFLQMMSPLQLTPNPASGVVTLTTSFADPYTLQIIDSAGRLVRQMSELTENVVEIDVSSLAFGMYVVRIGTGGGEPVETKLLVD